MFLHLINDPKVECFSQVYKPYIHSLLKPVFDALGCKLFIGEPLCHHHCSQFSFVYATLT